MNIKYIEKNEHENETIRTLFSDCLDYIIVLDKCHEVIHSLEKELCNKNCVCRNGRIVEINKLGICPFRFYHRICLKQADNSNLSLSSLLEMFIEDISDNEEREDD